jgi:hypothetical protein
MFVVSIVANDTYARSRLILHVATQQARVSGLRDGETARAGKCPPTDGGPDELRRNVGDSRLATASSTPIKRVTDLIGLLIGKGAKDDCGSVLWSDVAHRETTVPARQLALATSPTRKGSAVHDAR